MCIETESGITVFGNSDAGTLMIAVPPDISVKFREIADRIDFRDIDWRGGGKVERYHVTVKNGILERDFEKIAAFVAGTDDFMLAVGSMSVFHRKEKIVLQMAVQSRELLALNRGACDTFVYVDRWSVYRPHITLAYLKKDAFSPRYYRRYFTDELNGIGFSCNNLEYSVAGGEPMCFPLRKAEKKVVGDAVQSLQSARENSRACKAQAAAVDSCFQFGL